ncbi:Phosphatidylinositol transfer protein alpha isoform [Chionoecetes opilio]|uniref:Phosphatidylinositol transfer protein alpha isoform n=1 Tax=Chionoecetes opilio TaxID=41210 RepID=A0A8J5CS18_CHIOP|nr:Phosphatidylinositol transfer protein alpha isoform [Chionoecetes opilio]
MSCNLGGRGVAYHVGQLYSVAEMSKRETGGGEGVEVVTNEPFTGQPLFHGAYSSGQYTYKIFHLKKGEVRMTREGGATVTYIPLCRRKVPLFIRMLASEEALQIHEKSWNAYPYSRTVYSVHRLPAEQWRAAEVTRVDIVNDAVSEADYRADEDPAKVASRRTGRGPHSGARVSKSNGSTASQVQPVMTCYKLVSIDFRWFGLQTRVERYIQDFERRIFLKFHRQVVCWLDQWYGLTIDDIRKLEDDTQEALHKVSTTLHDPPRPSNLSLSAYTVDDSGWYCAPSYLTSPNAIMKVTAHLKLRELRYLCVLAMHTISSVHQKTHISSYALSYTQPKPCRKKSLPMV